MPASSFSTPRLFEEPSLVIATHNEGKVKEFQKLLGDFIPEIVSAGALDLPEPVEDGKTFLENAILKARAAAEASGRAALADDSGLCVEALGEAPGIYSARWGGPQKDMKAAMARVLQELEKVPSATRKAHFTCALALAWPDGHIESVEGYVHGEIAKAPRGLGGMGYDPIFLPEGEARTFGEMSAEEKNAISHRAAALACLKQKCFEK